MTVSRVSLQRRDRANQVDMGTSIRLRTGAVISKIQSSTKCASKSLMAHLTLKE